MPDGRNYPVARAVRVAEEIQRILSDVFLTEIRISTADLITVTDVIMSPDLRNANVYLSILNPEVGPEEVLRDLIRRRKEIRFHMASELQLKFMPQLRFYHDNSLEQSARINAILEDDKVRDHSGE